MKKGKQVILCICVLCMLLSSTVYAMNETETTTTVTYEQKEAKPGGIVYTPSNDEEAQKIYELDIPASVDLNETNSLPIRMSYCDLPNGKNVVIYIDGDRSFDPTDGYLHLKAAGEHEDVKVMVSRSTEDNEGLEEIGGPGLHIVAVFDWSWIFPSKYGQLSLDCLHIDEIEPDEYTGTIFFSIKIVDA